MREKRPVKNAYFKPVYFFLLLLLDAIVVAGIYIPQRANIRAAQDRLEDTQNQLNAIKIEYERQQENLEYMKTTDYKLQQGSAKYGWHYEEDTLLRDSDSRSLAGSPLPLTSPSPTKEPSFTPLPDNQGITVVVPPPAQP